MKLAAHQVGSGANVTFLHGFTQNRQSWDDITTLLAVSCMTIDLPGHGKSLEAKRHLQQVANDVAETMPVGALVGYSMGARVALHTALQQPHKVTSLILVSGTAGIEDDEERDSRRQSDESLANHIEEVGVTQFIDEWISQPIFAGLNEQNNQRASRLNNTAAGLADSLRFTGTGTQDPLWNRLSELSMPVLLICGETDTKFVQLAQRMHALIPNSQLQVIPDAGHTVHLENQADFIAVLENFLR